MILLFSFLMSFSAYAEDVPTVKVPVKEGFSTMDMGEFDRVKNFAPKKALSGSIGCRNSTGRFFKAGDEGYDACILQNANSNIDQNKNVNVPGTIQNTGQEVNFQFGQ